MNFEEAFTVAATAVFEKTRKHLNDAERQILEGSWEGQTYEKMLAPSCGSCFQKH
jgi:hypothetical protein